MLAKVHPIAEPEWTRLVSAALNNIPLCPEAIIELGRILNLKVVGEHIESAESMEYLRDFGCGQAQGYLFSKPLPAHEFESWCRTH